MIINDKELAQKLQNDMRELQSTVKKPNILLVGGTGVGKSSLINFIFGESIADTGVGKPLTQYIKSFESANSDVRLFDSRGYEIGEEGCAAFKSEVLDLAKRVSEPEKQIHLVWYCINSGGHRITDFDFEALRFFADNGIKTAVLFTKCDLVNETEARKLKDTMLGEIRLPIFEISSTMKDVSEHEKLIDWSIAGLPVALQDAFIKSQQQNLKAKWEQAHKIIAQHSIGNSAVGFTPIPFSDAPILVASQTAMIARILNLYNLGNLSNVLKGAGLELLMTNLGKSLVGSLVKFIPVVGWIVGGAINAAVAGSLTLALGEAVSAACYGVWKSLLSGNEAEASKKLEGFMGTVESYTRQYTQKKISSDEIKEPK